MVTTPLQHIESVMFMCEAKGIAVSTGHRMRASELEALTEPRSFRCGACGPIHTWTGKTARLGRLVAS